MSPLCDFLTVKPFLALYWLRSRYRCSKRQETKCGLFDTCLHPLDFLDVCAYVLISTCRWVGKDTSEDHSSINTLSWFWYNLSKVWKVDSSAVRWFEKSSSICKRNGLLFTWCSVEADGAGPDADKWTKTLSRCKQTQAWGVCTFPPDAARICVSFSLKQKMMWDSSLHFVTMGTVSRELCDNHKKCSFFFQLCAILYEWVHLGANICLIS